MTIGAAMIFSGSIVPGKEDEFNKWYDEHHIPLFSGKLPGVRNVRRYYSPKSDPQFVTIYEFDSFDALKKALASEESKAAGKDVDEHARALMTSSKYTLYNQVSFRDSQSP